MAEQSFADFINSERERLTAERTAIYDQQHELEQKLDAINKEMAAINAYAAVKEGKPAPAAQQTAPAKKQADAPKRARTPRGEGGIRTQVLDMVRKAGPEGIRSNDIALALQMDDKAGNQAIANALMALKKSGEVNQAGRRQPYTATENPEADQQEAA